ncbi:FAD-dependent monooxygenase [Enemella sp. A6]|uniref:FAD-dependent monooxygenase n=1 Tax=Enemella sp. A6 TaxID=3440152 RepID=UPI003EBD1C05
MQNHAIIVGAGIGGLATAIALGKTGWSVTVRERADIPTTGGTAVGMWPEAMRALDAIGVGDTVRRHSALSHGATILDPSGRLIARVPSSRSAHLIARERLVRILLDAVPPNTIHWSREVKPTDSLPESDLVVGADGIHSAVRLRTWGSPVERPLPTIAFRGVVDRGVEAVTETWGRGALFGITPTGDGRTNWFACLRHSHLEQSGADDVQTLRRRFSEWHLQIRRVLDGISSGDVDRRCLADVSLRHPYFRGNTVLVGDAAHAMAPNLGRGACEALVDAVVLAQALRSSGTIRQGLRRYDRARRAPTRRMVAMARILNRVATADQGAPARDRMLRLGLRSW